MSNLIAARSLLIALGLALLATPALADDPQFRWDEGLGGIYEESLGGVAVDGEGNTVCFGEFYDEIDLGGGSLTGTGGRDVFVAKYALDGSHLWSEVFGGPGNDSGTDVAVFSDGSVVISGAYRDSIDFGGGMIYDTGNTDGFLARFDSDGSHVWTKGVSGAGSEYVARIAIDSAESIFISGSFFTEIDFGVGPLFSNGASDMFVAKFGGDAAFTWARSFGSEFGEDEIYLSVDPSDDVVVTGGFTSTLDFGGGELVCGGETDMFLAKLSGTDGAHVWSDNYGGTGSAVSRSVDVDSFGNPVCVGEFLGTVNLGGYDMTSVGIYTDLFVAKFDPSGNHVWSNDYGTTGVEPPTDVAVDSQDQIFVSGYKYLGVGLDFGGGPLTDFGNSDAFLVQFDASGAHLWSRSYGDASMQTGDVLAIGPSDEVVLAGTYMGSPDFGGGPLTNHGDFDFYMVCLGEPMGSASGPVTARRISLGHGVPNPFNPHTSLPFTLGEDGRVTARIFDVRGRVVRILLDRHVASGTHNLRWDGRDDRGAPVGSGVYLCRIEFEGQSAQRKLALVR